MQVVPTLEEVFSFFDAQERRNTVLYIEMKTDRAEQSRRDLAGSVMKLIDKNNLRSRVVVVSFDLTAVAAIKQMDSSVSTGALFEPRRDAVKLIRNRQLIQIALECGADEILLHRLIATRRSLELATESNLRSVVWTVDDPKWLSRHFTLGIHALITNKPAAFA